ncbi:hypothetical protein GHT06_012455 [Daphnia sinensis]|uniref:Uncharacterized protein n=1 Tax=Daphnia sinensis TaxID=1820382 RepID=A0AAD5PW62_9CRUS|nr:hypothetical protein GHT06_012455 [Daphnia sinensis]
MTIMSRLFNVTLIVALMLVTNIQVTDSFGWKREYDFHDGINGSKQSIGNQMRQKRTSVAATVDGKFTLQLIVNVDPVTGQVSLPQTIHGGRYRTVPNARRTCQGRQCTLALQTVSPPVTPVFTDSKRTNNSQSKTAVDEKVIQNNKRVTAAPRYLNPKQVSTVRYPLPTLTRKQIINRTRIENGEWARRTSARKPSVLTTTARNLVNSRKELLLPKTRNNSESERPKETDNVLHQKRNETDSYSNHSDKVGKVVQSSQFNESIFRDAEKPITVHSSDIVSPKPITGHSGEGGGNLNPEQSYSPNRDPSKLQANQTTEGRIASGSPTKTPTHCEELDCLPWIRRANFEVQIHPRTMQIVNIRVPIITAKSKQVRPSHEYEDLRNTGTSLAPTNSTRKQDEFPWQHRDGYEVQINPKTEQVDSIRAQQNATHQTTKSPHEEYENSSAEKQVTSASEALEQTTIYTKHEKPRWIQIGHHQVQIDQKTGQIVNIRTQTNTKQNLAQNPENPSTQTQEGSSVRTQMVTREAHLPVPFYYRKQITSQSSNPEPVTHNITKESETVIHGRTETTTNSYSTPQPRQEPNEFPWQQRDGFEVQINPVTKEVVNVRLVQHSRHVPLTMHAEQATIPNNLTQSTTEPGLIMETSRHPDVFLRQHEVDDKVQTREKTTTGDVKTQSSPKPIQTSSSKGDGEDGASSPTPDSQVPTPEVADISVPVTGIPMTTTTLVPVAELSEEDLPWEQRDDYEIQINPITKQIVNIRLQTTTTHNPVSKSTLFDDAHDADGNRVRSQTRDRTVDISTFVKLDERDDVSVEHDLNSKIQTLIIPRRKDVGGHPARIDGQLQDETRSRIAVLAVPNQKDDAIRKTLNSPARKPQLRTPIFSHSDADGLLYFRYDDLLEQLEPFNRDAKFVLIDENSWIASRPVRGRDSPYFYYSHSSSLLMNMSCYLVLLVACLVFLIS